MKNLNLIIGNLLCHPIIGGLIKILYRDKIPGRGFYFTSQSKVVSSKNIASIFWGLHERKEVEFIKSYLDPNNDIIELGASIGVITMEILKKVNPDRKLICVEANPDLIPIIQENIRLNFYNRQVDVVNFAIDYSGNSIVQFEIDRNNLGSHVIVANSLIQETNIRNIATITLKKLHFDNNLTKFSLISDIEGAEIGFILSEKELLKNCFQLFIELHPVTFENTYYSTEEMCKIIQKEHGFNLINSRNNNYYFTK